MKTWFGTEAFAPLVTQTLVNARATAGKVALQCYPDDRTSEDLFADVGPSDDFTITLGGLFWQAPDRGFNCKAGAFVQELTHLLLVAGSDDLAYGEDSQGVGASRTAASPAQCRQL